MSKCPLCFKKILAHSKKNESTICNKTYHLNCVTLSPEERDYLQTTIWYCTLCTSSLFPFNGFEDDSHFREAIEEFSSMNIYPLRYLSDKLFVPFELNMNDHSFPGDINPDLHFFNSISHHITKCNYYLESSFNADITAGSCIKKMFSPSHIDIRSMTKNLNYFENYIRQLDHNFTIIGFSETWLQEFNSNLYGLNGYAIVERHRLTPGGGVEVCISDNVNFMERQDLELFDEIMEFVCVEINKSQVQSLKDIIVGVIYCPHNKDIDIFNNHMKLLLDKLKKENKSCYILGDMNINILNQETHTKTGQFVDIMFSNSFLPVITRPTRVTVTSATLIDHIFTNAVDNLIVLKVYW